MPKLAPPIAAFCDHLVTHDLPDLPADRRADVVSFAERRTAGLPTPMRVGVTIIAVVVAGMARVLGGPRTATLLSARPVPLFGEYVRMLRSLNYAYVWETWPATRPTGAPADV